MDILTILIIVVSIVAIVGITYSVKENRQIESMWDDREEFFSSACDESLIYVKGFSINKKSGVIEWHVDYKSANFVVSDDSIRMYKYLTPEMIDMYDYAMNVPEEDRPNSVWWGLNR